MLLFDREMIYCDHLAEFVNEHVPSFLQDLSLGNHASLAVMCTDIAKKPNQA